MDTNERVLIAGAGPVGFTTAYNLARRGIPFTLLEAGDKIFDDPRAGTIHPPTLEMYDEVGVTAEIMRQGFVVSNYQYRDRKKGVVADFDLSVLKDDTPFPYRVMLEQHKLCYILRDLLKSHGDQEILMNHQITKVEQDADGVTAHVSTPEGPKTFRGKWMIGCDGGRSQVRKSMNVDFEGFTYPERFLILSTRYDFAQHGYAITNYIADPEEWCALFKVPGNDGKGMWRVVFPTHPDETQEQLFEDEAVQRRIQGFNPKDGPYEVAHRNLYSVHQRVASSYRDGRLLVAGDAAHINNPLGGMGMNFGVHDSFNVTEKLARIWFDGASHDLLDLYDRQRRTVAQEYLQRQTIENKKNLEMKDPEARERFHEELRAIAADRAKLHPYLLRVAMIEGVRRARSIT
ncbi:MAG TPA: NAD(P)/FAD-dependent oxidoreductase [Beijerinckiaceae bacterium]